MTTFDERERAFELAYGHDQEMQFKARARRNKMLGLWTAGLIGKSDADVEVYARDIVMAEFEKSGDHDIVHTAMHDSAASRKPTEEHAIRRQAERLLAQAKQQIMAEVKK